MRSPAILFGPNSQAGANPRATGVARSVGRWHNNYFAFSGHLKKEIRMLSTERRELSVGHRTSRDSSRQINIVDHKGHRPILAPVHAK